MGLNNKEVIESRKKYGSNIITQSKKESFIHKYISSLSDPIIRILIIALGIKLCFLMKTFDWYETIGIVIAIFVASFISTISEYGSEKAFQKLQEENDKIKCRVKRNNKIIEISIDEVVKNDIIILNTGDKICADGTIVEGSIYLDESSINGEVKEKYKVVNDIVYRGTIVYNGYAIMKVNEVGNNTFFGKIAKELQIEKVTSPLKIRLLKLAKIISIFGYISAFLVFFSYLFSNIVINNNYNPVLIKQLIDNYPLLIKYILDALTLAVTVIVVSVPEGLPMMITLVLSSNMNKLLKQKVLVRKLVGIETSGNINILFTDKTGTLTKGKMEVVSVLDGSLHKYHNLDEIKYYNKYYELIKLSFICNNTSTYINEPVGGNITDKALIDFIKENSNFKLIDKKLFNSKDKYSSCTFNYNNRKMKLLKGAPEIILDKCTLYYDNTGKIKNIISKNKLISQIDELTNQGIRVIAASLNDILVCIIAIKDPIKLESKKGINLINKAHIQTVMITGDNKNTACAIGKEVGILKDKSDIILTSNEFNLISDYNLAKILPNLRIIARALPTDKSRIIKICQDNNIVVGMTGDGVNDAPALKKADIGFAMGNGTEVAKEASDIVILNNSILAISSAILFGRTIYKSIRKFIIFQLTVNLCAVTLSIIGPFIGVESPVTVIQMLWINMVMDTLAGLAFSFEPSLDEYMEEYPKKKNESIINKYMVGEILYTGIYSSLLCIFFLKSPTILNFFRNQGYFLTGFFGLFIFMSIFNCFNARTHRLNLLSNLEKNRVYIYIILFIIIVQILLIYYGGTVFRTTGLDVRELTFIILLSFSVIPIDWSRKIFLRIKGKRDGV